VASLPFEGLLKSGIDHQKHVIGKDNNRAVKVLPRILKGSSLLKRAFVCPSRGSVSHTHLQTHCNEFELRFNRRNSASRWLLFKRMLGAAPQFPRPPSLS
jgi:hypothetical protein